MQFTIRIVRFYRRGLLTFSFHLTSQAGPLRGRKGTNTTGPHPAYGAGGHHQGASGGDVDPVASPHHETGGGLFQGDIVPDYESILEDYGPEVVQELEEQGLLIKGQNETNSTLRQADVNRRWTTRVNGVVHVPYSFAGQHDANAVAVIENAIKELGDRSRVVKFVRRSSERDYIIVVDGAGCSSFVGKQGGQQPVTLSRNVCVTRGVVQHEFLHALGFNHEQSRPDRDSFVKINFENIKPEMKFNFDKMTGTDSLGSPYDYGSVMHYSKTAFSANGRDTITAPQAIGQQNAADDEDIRQVILLYQCVSGARSLTKYLASPCNEDCKCWEGASGCNGNNNACQPGLVCNASNQCAKSGGAANARSFRSLHGTFLSAWTDNSARLVNKADAWERFTVESAGNGKLSIRSDHGTYLSAWPDARVRFMSHALAWEQWTPVQNSDGSLSLLSIHGTYLSAWTDGSVRLATHNQAWEHWF